MAVLAAVDERERSRTVVDIAWDLADAYDDDLVALHVVPDEDFDSHKAAVKDIPGFQDYSFSQEVESAKRFVRDFVLETGVGVDPDRLEPRGRVGDITTEIIAEANEIEPRFLVISGRRRSPAGKAVFGSAAQRILLNARCPVVTQLSDE